MKWVTNTMDYVWHIVGAIARLLINPVFYVALIVAIYLGYLRVKSERRYFNTRIMSGWLELKQITNGAAFYAMLLSIIFIAVGMVVPELFLWVVGALSLIGLITLCVGLLSPAYIFPLAAGFLWFLAEKTDIITFGPFVWQSFKNMEPAFVSIAFITALAVIVEGLLIRSYYYNVMTPIAHKTKRGMHAIIYRAKKIWLLPVFFVIPGDVFLSYLPYWPQFTLGEQKFALLLFPLVIGLSAKSRKTFPTIYYHDLGQKVLGFGVLLLAGALVSMVEPFAAVITLATALIGRMLIAFIYKTKEYGEDYAVVPSAKGVIIAGILPDSPAEKMGLLIGECIAKVNGVAVHSEDELYEAIQINAAYCKLEVYDLNGEIRLTQHALFSNDHYRIGILTVNV